MAINGYTWLYAGQDKRERRKGSPARTGWRQKKL